MKKNFKKVLVVLLTIMMAVTLSIALTGCPGGLSDEAQAFIYAVDALPSVNALTLADEPRLNEAQVLWDALSTDDREEESVIASRATLTALQAQIVTLHADAYQAGLVADRATAVTTLNTAFGTRFQETNFRSAQWTQLQGYLTQERDAINALTTRAAVAAYTTSWARFDAVQTDAEITTAEVAAARTTRIASINSAFSAITPAPTGNALTIMQALRDAAIAEVNALTTVAAIEAFDQAARFVTINAVPTELESRRNTVNNAVTALTQAHFSTANWTRITNYRDNAITAINGLTTHQALMAWQAAPVVTNINAVLNRVQEINADIATLFAVTINAENWNTHRVTYNAIRTNIGGLVEGQTIPQANLDNLATVNTRLLTAETTYRSNRINALYAQLVTGDRELAIDVVVADINMQQGVNVGPIWTDIISSLNRFAELVNQDAEEGVHATLVMARATRYNYGLLFNMVGVLNALDVYIAGREFHFDFNATNWALAQVALEGVRADIRALATTEAIAEFNISTAVTTATANIARLQELFVGGEENRVIRNTGAGYLGFGVTGGGVADPFMAFRLNDEEELVTTALSTAAHREIPDSDFIVDYILLHVYRQEFCEETLTHGESIRVGSRRIYWQFRRNEAGLILNTVGRYDGLGADGTGTNITFAGWIAHSAPDMDLVICYLTGAILEGTGTVAQGGASGITHVDVWPGAAAILEAAMGVPHPTTPAANAVRFANYYVRTQLVPREEANVRRSPISEPFRNNRAAAAAPGMDVFTAPAPPVWGGAIHPYVEAANAFIVSATNIEANLSNIIYTNIPTGTASLALITAAQGLQQAINMEHGVIVDRTAAMRAHVAAAYARFQQLEQGLIAEFDRLVNLIPSEITAANAETAVAPASVALAHFDTLMERTQYMIDRAVLDAALAAIDQHLTLTVVELAFLAAVDAIAYAVRPSCTYVCEYVCDEEGDCEEECAYICDHLVCDCVAEIVVHFPGFNPHGADSWGYIARAQGLMADMPNREREQSDQTRIDNAIAQLTGYIVEYNRQQRLGRTPPPWTGNASGDTNALFRTGFAAGGRGNLTGMRGNQLGTTWMVERQEFIKGVQVFIFLCEGITAADTRGIVPGNVSNEVPVAERDANAINASIGYFWVVYGRKHSLTTGTYLQIVNSDFFDENAQRIDGYPADRVWQWGGGAGNSWGAPGINFDRVVTRAITDADIHEFTSGTLDVRWAARIVTYSDALRPNIPQQWLTGPISGASEGFTRITFTN
ncbi:MAG: hypothetical protein FWE13_05135 [Firmicutes bacterium]|nr:hypothetical protein [Bacillota bacterium]